MPRLGLYVWAALVLAGLTAGCASLQMPSMPEMPKFTSAPPGSKGWWRSHKSKAKFVPGSGWQVAGADGYFDDDGRPINSPALKKVDDKKGGGLLGDANLQRQIRDIRDQVGMGPNEQESQKSYDAGMAAFREKKYGESAKHFKTAMKLWPDSALEQDAMFALAESQFFGERYWTARNTYEKLIKKYPSTPHMDVIVTRQFAIGRYWEQYQAYNPNWPLTPNLVDKHRPWFDTIGFAMKNYENIRINDPTGPLADDAIMASANSYFVRGRYGDADEQYELLRKEYPRSEHQFDAHVLGLQSKLRRYQGPDYDITPLEEAQTLIKQLKVQFAGKLDPDQRNRLTQIDGQIKKEFAQRDFNRAKHYEKLEEFGSAKFYYAEVLKRHGNTEFASEARTQLAALDGLPDRPSSSLDPILDLVPQNAERTAITQVPLIKQPDATAPLTREETPQLANKKDGASGTTNGDGTVRR